MSDWGDASPPPANEAGAQGLESGEWPAKEQVNYKRLIEDDADPNTKWGHLRSKYEYLVEKDSDLGDVGPRVLELENELFRDVHKIQQGDNIRAYHEFEVKAEGPESISPIRSFDEAELHPILLQNIQLMQYTATTPVQSYVIPAVMQGYDVVAIAQTGSGKTAAYLVPVFSVLMGKAKKLAKSRPNPLTFDPRVDGICAEPLVLVVCPTRELALQIFDEARRLSYRSMLRPCLAYGGGPRRGQLDDIKRGCDILIGTPGRLQDFLVNEPRWLSLRRVKYTILDEADEMLEPDWEAHMSCMLGGSASQADAQHQYMMFSATFSRAAREIAKKFLQDEHLFVKVGRIGSIHRNVTQQIIWVEEDQKQKALLDLILSEPPTRTLVFVNTSHKADIVDDFLYNHDIPTACIHSLRTQLEREHALRTFRTGKTPVLIATGVSARGLDIKAVMHVINLDIPSHNHGGITEYVHRIGRTARIGHIGRASSFYNKRDEGLSESLVKVLMDTDQVVPDFLEEFKPEKLTWDDESDGEDGNVGTTNVNATAGVGWGAAATDAGAWGAEKSTPAVDDAWGTANSASAVVDTWETGKATTTGDGWASNDETARPPMPASGKGSFNAGKVDIEW